MATEVKTKSITRPEWTLIERKSFCFREFETAGLSGVAAVLSLEKVSAPYAVRSARGEPLIIADDGYFWLQLAPRDCHWWLTAMYDRTRTAVQFYFDITRRNHVRGGASCFEDLMLDVVLTPGGDPLLLDADDLHEALALGSITQDEADMAMLEARRLITGLQKRQRELTAFCDGMMELLLRNNA